MQYDDAISHYQTALEMAKALKSNVDILKILLRMGWVYIEAQSFAEAEKIFNEADSKYKQYFEDKASLTKTTIDIGILFSQIERAIALCKNIFTGNDKSSETLKNIKKQVDIEIEGIEKNAKKELANIIEQKPLDDTQKYDEIQKIEVKKARLLALYHECLGRLNWKQGEMDEAEKEFEKSISYMTNPRVYLYLAEFYLPEVSKYRIGRKKTLLAKARNACKLCRQTDLRLQYKQEVDDFLKKLEALEK